MSEPTKLDLNDDTIETIQDLIQANIDAAQGFEDAADKAEDSYFRNAFTGLGQQRHKQAGELQYYVLVNGERAENEGSWLAAFQRGWMDLRAALNGGDESYLASQMQMAESQLEQAYINALQESEGSPICDVLNEQLLAVQDGKRRVEQLYNRAIDTR